MRRRVAVTFALAALAIGAGSLVAAENPQPGLQVSQKGNAVAIQTALAVDEGDGSVKLFFSSATPGCAAILAPARRLASGEVSFELTGSASAPSSEWMVYYSGYTTNAPEGTEIVVDDLDPSVGAKSSGRIKALLEGAREGDTLQVDGTFEAVGCGGK